MGDSSNATDFLYSRFAKSASHFCGRPRTFMLAVTVIVVWIVTGLQTLDTATHGNS
ncbi:low affinity iron permease family protein [Methylomonas lenta]|uniref:low affinity iron permease family protein n=1 Tax=Methylomonas lenta TaxID=980561 RepID=UPI0038BC4485